MSKMRQWIAEEPARGERPDKNRGKLPDKIRKVLRRRIKRTLNARGLPYSDVRAISRDLEHEAAWAFEGRKHRLKSGVPGRPANGISLLLSINVDDVLERHGIKGNWLGLGDKDENGLMGIVAELEAIVQAAFSEACGHPLAVMARPARISEARKILGKVTRE